MDLYYSNQLKVGFKVIYHNEPYIVVSNEFIKPGKGQAFFRIKLKNLLNKKLIDKTCKSMDFFKTAHIIEIVALYMFNNRKVWTFMNKKNFEQIFVEKIIIKDICQWLIEQHEYIVMLWNDQPISITFLKNFIDFRVINTTPCIKSNFTSSNSKLATLNTGAIIKVPNFIHIGQKIKVDVRTGEYVSKVK